MFYISIIDISADILTGLACVEFELGAWWAAAAVSTDMCEAEAPADLNRMPHSVIDVLLVDLSLSWSAMAQSNVVFRV